MKAKKEMSVSSRKKRALKIEEETDKIIGKVLDELKKKDSISSIEMVFLEILSIEIATLKVQMENRNENNFKCD